MPTMSPESHVVEAAQRLTTALKGNIPANSETAVGLTKLGELFSQIATAKAAAAATQLALANDRQTIKMHPTPTATVPVPRVDVLVFMADSGMFAMVRGHGISAFPNTILIKMEFSSGEESS